MNFSFVHDFDIDPKSYWEISWSDEYCADLYKQLNMRSRTVLSQKDEGGTILRSQKLDPSTSIPSWATSVIKDTGYIEHDTFHRERSSMDVRIEPLLMKDRFQMNAVYSVTAIPGAEGRCRREFRGEIKIAVPLLGGKLEKLMVEQIRDAYETAARVTRDWVGRRKT